MISHDVLAFIGNIFPDVSIFVSYLNTKEINSLVLLSITELNMLTNKYINYQKFERKKDRSKCVSEHFPVRNFWHPNCFTSEMFPVRIYFLF